MSARDSLDARAIVGYTSDVDWLEAESFEVLLLDEIVSARQSAAMFRRFVTDHPHMAKKLGVIVATGSSIHSAESLEGKEKP